MTKAARWTVFGAYTFALALANLDVLRALVEFSRGNPSASHLLVVPCVTVALIWWNRSVIFAKLAFDWRGASAALIAALACLVAGRSGEASGEPLASAVAALVLCWAAGFLCLFGRDAGTAARFPLLFLLLMVPVPGVLLDRLVGGLLASSSSTVAALFTLTGTPYERAGFIFALPTVTIEIARECSGIRSTIALLLTSLIAGHFGLRSAWSKLLLAAAVLPIAILKNGIRIVTLSLLAMHVEPGFLSGRLHTDGGVVFFVLATVLLGPVLLLLRASERRRERAG